MKFNKHKLEIKQNQQNSEWQRIFLNEQVKI